MFRSQHTTGGSRPRRVTARSVVIVGVIALAASLFNAPPAMAAPQAAVTFVVSPTQIRVGEAPYVSGTATYGGRPAAGAVVVLIGTGGRAHAAEVVAQASAAQGIDGDDAHVRT